MAAAKKKISANSLNHGERASVAGRARGDDPLPWPGSSSTPMHPSTTPCHPLSASKTHQRASGRLSCGGDWRIVILILLSHRPPRIIRQMSKFSLGPKHAAFQL